MTTRSLLGVLQPSRVNKVLPPLLLDPPLTHRRTSRPPPLSGKEGVVVVVVVAHIEWLTKDEFSRE